MGNLVLYPHMCNFAYGDRHMHMGIPVCKRAGIAEKFANGDPITHNEIVRIWGLTHIPRRGPNQQWVYPPSDKVLEECGMHTIGHYIDMRRETIAKYVVGRSIFAECQGADQRRGSVPRRWWWEQRMCLDDV
jgi:hypothetical protein